MLGPVHAPSSPKREQFAPGKAGWYWYHAGFSPSFVTDVLAMTGVSPAGLIVDPWNGSGTTTQVAHDHGFAARGYDLNPVMVTVAKARLLGTQVVPSHAVLARHILKKAARYRAPV